MGGGKLSSFIHKKPARFSALCLGGAFSLSCITLLGEGLDHLRVFLPLAALNLGVGLLASERVARVFLVAEAGVIVALLLQTLFQLRESHATT
jgi:hypothetical protein